MTTNPSRGGVFLALSVLACVIETSGPGGVYRPYGGTLPASSMTAPSVTWSTNAIAFRGSNGLRVLYECPSGGGQRSAWGTDIYTDDSSVCAAAAHYGRINFSGGPVVIEIRPGQDSYAGSSRNGVSTNSYGGYHGSFTVL